MSILELSNQPQIKQIITHPDDDNAIWRGDLERFLAGDSRLTRHSAGESAIIAVQRLLIFLGYSTAASGGFLMDGDFGRGTNRGVAQFQMEYGLGRKIDRAELCYPCRWNTASKLIDAIPDATLTVATLEKMAQVALERLSTGQVVTGDFDNAIFHLNALHKRQFLSCRDILDRYGQHAEAACDAIRSTGNIDIRIEWVLSIIKQETAGIIRPRFEQHYLSRLNDEYPEENFRELRMRSMSQGLGQIMGTNYSHVGANSATELFLAPEPEQVAFVARFIAPKHKHVMKADPTEEDFRAVAKFYNGPAYEAHYYHEKLSRWFREFRTLT